MSITLCVTCGHSLPPPPAVELHQLQPLLRSNAVPPDGKMLSAAACTALERYDAEVDRLISLVADLVADRAAFAVYDAACRTIGGPTGGMPSFTIILCLACRTSFTPFDVEPGTNIQHLPKVLPLVAVPPDGEVLSSTAENAFKRYDAQLARILEVMADLVPARDCLTAYDAACNSLCAPIRRLPQELLAEIFQTFSVAEEKRLTEVATAEDELHRLAKHNLLVLSQVSSYWHTIAMNTPQLWSTILCDTSRWKELDVEPDVLLSLLKSLLIRGGNYPLTMELAGSEEDSYHQAVLSLVCEHSQRWRKVTIWSDGGPGRYLMGAKGNMGHLEQLHICADWSRVNVFRVAPRLKEFTFSGDLDRIPEIPWAQIRRFQYFAPAGSDPGAAISLLANTRIREFLLDCDLFDLRLDHDTAGRCIHSEVEKLELCLAMPPQTLKAVGQLFRSLILPRLRTLSITPRVDAEAPAVCRPSDFLQFAQQSSLHSHLTGLKLDAVIADRALLRCLAALPLLEKVSIADPGNSDYNLITDTLLHGISQRTPQKTLIPRLRLLVITTRFAFTDEAYLHCISSRMGACNPSFDNRLFSRADRCREPSQAVMEVLARSRSQRKVAISCDKSISRQTGVVNKSTPGIRSGM
ncbi:hypothetical protein C8R47DRAFT_1229177 [Mycena vitilis]|nr:hypothetical protein C8R47DRAFT_1229177 [Mycena vitilis]